VIRPRRLRVPDQRPADPRGWSAGIGRQSAPARSLPDLHVDRPRVEAPSVARETAVRVIRRSAAPAFVARFTWQ